MVAGRLLIIDDDKDVGEFIKTVADRCGYESWCTSDPVAFKTTCAETKPDVIVLDLAMPGVDGIEMLRYLSDVECRAKLLIISGFDGRVRESAQRFGNAKGLNMVGIVKKPVRVADLRATLEGLSGTG